MRALRLVRMIGLPWPWAGSASVSDPAPPSPRRRAPALAHRFRRRRMLHVPSPWIDSGADTLPSRRAPGAPPESGELDPAVNVAGSHSLQGCVLIHFSGSSDGDWCVSAWLRHDFRRFFLKLALGIGPMRGSPPSCAGAESAGSRCIRQLDQGRGRDWVAMRQSSTGDPVTAWPQAAADDPALTRSTELKWQAAG
jgi:hypothetical protein